MGEGGHDTNTSGSVEGRVTIAEAAKLLNVHPNTVRNRVKSGTYKADKIVTERGPTWMIDRDSLITNTPTSGSQQTQPQEQSLVNAQATALVRELLRPFVEDLGRVREELGAERARREQAERERDELAARLEALEVSPEPRESPETVVEVTSSGYAPPTPEEGTERRSSWWRRLFGAE